MKIQLIDKSQFAQIEGARQIIAHDHSRQFAVIKLGEYLGSYAISWRSDLIGPIVKKTPDEQTVWIGVDQQLAAINLQNGRIIIAMSFPNYIVKILTLSKVTAVLTEWEVLLFNPGGTVRLIEDLPEQAIGMSVVDENLLIQLLEGERLILNPETGCFIDLAVAASV